MTTMLKKMLPVLALTAAGHGCSPVKLPEMPAAGPTEAGIKRYGQYCEQLGHARGSREFSDCVRKQEELYR
jgi:hypothetical protein